MSDSSQLALVATALADAGYGRVAGPLTVSSIEFSFDATFISPRALDLVVVADLLKVDAPEIVSRRLQGLARALDMVGSRRSLTLVILGPPPMLSVTNALGQVARILVVDPGKTVDLDAAVRDALAVLMPLRIDVRSTELASTGAAALAALRARFQADVGAEVFAATEHTSSAVAAVVIAALEADLACLEEE